jgi:DNA-binding CsgD family transcriptional regulator/PAS domain-containing protein
VIDLPGVTAQALSDVIGEIYDCSLDPAHWPSTCRRIADLCESTAGGLCVHDLRHVQNDQLFVFGYEQGFLEKLGEHYAESPMAVADVVASIGDVSSLSMADREFAETRFSMEVLQPFGLKDILWLTALRTGGRTASMHASRGENKRYYQQHDVDFFKLLSPHVCRALAISDTLDMRALRSELLEKTLDGLSTGVFLAARDGHVVYMNPAAERQVKDGRSIRLVNQRLSPTDASARAAMSEAMGTASRAEAEADMNARTVAMPDGLGGGYVASLLPVGRGLRQDILAPFAATVAVFTQDPVEAPFMPGEAFARLHGLTGSELRVLMALSQGLGGMEVADMLGIGEPTLRTHLQRMFSKTRTAKQGDLMRLLHQSTPPVRAA